MEAIHSAQDISANWLTEVLREHSSLNSTVTEVIVEPIGVGVGLLSEVNRLHITYAAKEDLPTTMIAKLASLSENRELARMLDFYTREVNFYRHMGDSTRLNVPRCYFAAIDPTSYDYTLLIEDLGDVVTGDQLVGASEPEVRLAVSTIAGLHADYWGKTTDPGFAWMFDMSAREHIEAGRDMIYLPSIEPTFTNFGHLFDDNRKHILSTVGDQLVDLWMPSRTNDLTFIHGDYRQDNVLFEKNASDVLVFDWQTFCVGEGIFDIGYFMCQSVDSDRRQQIDQEVVRLYVDTLASLGIQYSFDQAWADYRRTILCCLVYAIVDTGTLDTGNDRGRQLAECTMSRNLRAIEDLDCMSLL
ncbi:MAG: phosphotransferase [Pseudomonadota bacterium]